MKNVAHIATARCPKDLWKMIDALEGIEYQITNLSGAFDYLPSEDEVEAPSKFEYHLAVNPFDKKEAVKRLRAISFSLE